MAQEAEAEVTANKEEEEESETLKYNKMLRFLENYSRVLESQNLKAQETIVSHHEAQERIKYLQEEQQIKHMMRFEEKNRIREEKRDRARRKQREREVHLQQQVNFKDQEIQKSVDQLNLLKAEHFQQKAQEKQLRMQVVNKTADTLKK